MKKIRGISLIIATLLIIGSNSVFAAGAGAVADFLKFNGNNKNAYNPVFNEKGKLISVVSGDISDFNSIMRSSKEDAVSAAYKFLRENSGMFNITDIKDLKVEKTSYTKGMSHIIFAHYLNGKKVFRSEISIHVNGSGRVAMVNNNYIPAFEKNLRTPAISSEEAVRTAESFNGCEKTRGKSRVSEIIYSDDKLCAAAFLVEIPSEKPLGDLICVIDAGTGKVLENHNILQNSVPLGTVYLSNPIKCKVTMEPLANLTLAPDKKRLTGKWVNVVNDKWVIIYPNEGDNYNYNATDSNFDELNAYYHTNLAHDYFNKFGFTALDSPIKVIVHFGTQQDNAFYSPLEHVMGFGDGRHYYSFAKEESIIYHEYTHAVTNAIVKLDYESEAGAINEAFSDYFAGSMTDDAETGEWIVSKVKEKYLRTMENRAHYPEDITREVHIDSQIYSAGLWDLRKTIGARDADALIHFSGYYLQGKPGAKFTDALLALIASDKEHFSGKYTETIKKVMAARGIGTAHAGDHPPGKVLDALRFEALNGNIEELNLLDNFQNGN